MPGATADPIAVVSEVPELPPEDSVELEAGTPPKSISAEQSAALLKTLDQLAGEDIRIEDTGVEWRVLEDPEDETQDGAESETEAEPEVLQEAESQIEEMRFDDNTPLPDDFDFDSEPSSPPESIIPEITKTKIHVEVDKIKG